MADHRDGARRIQVAVSGAAGQVAYALLTRLTSGEVFGPRTSVTLRLLELETAVPALNGVAMELEDCAFPLLDEVVVTSDPAVAFDGASWALLLGAVPRKAGQQRGDLISVNGRIFKPLGEALNVRASEDVRILVVGNPCNTNCLIAQRNAPDIASDRWFAMTALDHNRAVGQLAKKSGATAADVGHLAIWGNHSSTMFPDYFNATIRGKPATSLIDPAWFEREFLPTVRERGAAIIKARGHSSAASAANAIVDSVRAVHIGTDSRWMSQAVVSDGSYAIPEGLVFSFPIVADADSWKIVGGIEHGEFAREQLRLSLEELVSERDVVADLLPS